MELLPANETFRVSERDRAADDRGDSELIAHEDFACTTSGATAVTHAELERGDEDVAIALLISEHFKHRRRPRENAEAVHLIGAVVIERTRLSDLRENSIDCDRAREGEPTHERQCIFRDERL